MKPCIPCKGEGEVYLRIGCDVHIAKCAACSGLGRVSYEETKMTADPKKFGRINLDEFLNDDLSKSVEAAGGMMNGTYVETK